MVPNEIATEAELDAEAHEPMTFAQTEDEA